MVALLGVPQVETLCRAERIVHVSVRIKVKDIVAPSLRVKVNLPICRVLQLASWSHITGSIGDMPPVQYDLCAF